MSQISMFMRRVLAVVTAVVPAVSMAAITGTVFQDYNGNGQFDTAGTASATASDRGIAGITVTAYGANNAVCGAATTVAAGTYSLTPSTAGACAGVTTYRLEFTTLPANFLPGARSTDSVANGVANGSGSSTQFVADGATDVNLAVNIPCDYCENNPTLSAPRFVGNGLSDQTAALTFPFVSGITAATAANGAAELVPTTHGLDLKSQDIGAVWGSSYARQKRTLFFSAFQKRHSAYAKTTADPDGLNGTGRIYFAQKPGTAAGPATVTTAGLLVDLEALFPASTTIAGDNHSTANNWDDDTVAFTRVGRVAFGDVAVSRDESKLYAVSLNDKRIYSIPLSSPIAQVTSTAGVSSVSILSLANVPVTTTAGGLGCPSNADLIPGAINVNRYTGDIYFGLTCVASGTGATPVNSPDRLRAFVYKWDGVAASATQVANFPLDYARQCLSSDTGDLNNCPANSDGEWLPWSDNTADLRGPTGTVYGQVSRPQPWLMNIDFDESNNMILGLVDRLGHQTGNDKGTASVGLVEGVSGGDTLKLTPSTTTVGTWNPPAVADFYSGDSYSGTAHGEIGLGGLVYVPGTNQVVSAAFDPVTDGAFRTGGAIWFDNATGAKTRQYMMFGLDAAGTFGKVAGVGDIELLCEVAPIEIGNRVWRDANGNGVQDPDELGIAGVEVQLIDAATGTVVSTTTTTDVNGEYYFNAANVPDGDLASAGDQPGIKPNTNYIVRVINAAGASKQAALTGLIATAPNSSGDGVAGSGLATNDPILDVRDSDATISGTNADIAYNSGAAGNNNHGLDFGFAPGYSIGNRVWNDNGAGGGTANDGIRNGTEPGIGSVTVELLSGTTVVGTTTTDANGYYRFDNLAAGSYTVRITKPAGFVNTTVPATGAADNATDNDNNSATEAATTVTSPTIVLGPGDSEPTNEADLVGGAAAGNAAANGGNDARGNMTVDFGLRADTYSIGNRVFSDTNGDGTQQAGEPGLAGVQVRLLDSAGNPVAGLATQTTDANGYYRFDNLPAGSYIVEVVGSSLPAGVSSSPNVAGDQGDKGTASGADYRSGTVQVGAGLQPTGELDLTATGAGAQGPRGDANTNSTIDFGFVPAPVYSIGDLVWIDTNNNGIRDTGEAALSGATVQLFAAAGGSPTGPALGSVPTDANGRYRFDGLAAGDYVVVVTPPAGYVSSTNRGTGATTANELDNGQDTPIAAGNPGAGGFRSGVITLTGTGAPTGELNNAAAIASGSVAGAGGDAADNRSNRTVDFGFYQPFDLRMTKAITSSGTYVPGSTVTYSLTARNLGPGAAGAAIVVKDQLPTGLTAVSAAGTNWSCTPQTGAAIEITCTRTATTVLAASADADVIIVTATVDAGVAGNTNLANKAQVNPSAADVAAGKTELNPLGTGDNGYDDGNNAIGSNNDDAKTITVAALNYSIGNRVWNDNGAGGGTANDGIRNGTEPGIGSVTVELLSGTTVVGTTTTDANGYYRFDNLAAGSYTVRITKPAGFVNTTVPATGAADNATDNDNNSATEAATTVTSPTIVLGPGDSEPTNEADLVGGAAAGNAAANGGNDARGNMTVDFGLRADTYSIGNRVFSDTNGDGTQQAGEPGLAGVQVRLLDSAGNPVAGLATQTTDANGYYRFDNLPAGSYIVEVVGSSLPAGVSSSPNVAGDQGDKGTASGADYRSGTVQVGAGLQPTGELDLTATGAGAQGPRGDANTNSTIDFGFVPAPVYSIGNRVWNDVNNNGLVDTGESGIANATVYLYADTNNDGTPDGAPIAQRTTDTNGYYLFTNLNAGTYIVGVDPASLPPAGAGLAPFKSSTGTVGAATGPFEGAATPDPDDDVDSNDSGSLGAALDSASANVPMVLSKPITLTLAGETTSETDIGPQADTAANNNSNLTVDFGFFRPASLGNFVFEDRNNNGLQDAGEPGIAGVTVELYKDGALTASTTTGANGEYLFDNLVPSTTYVVDFIPTAGLQPSPKDQGSNDALDSDASITTGLTDPITLTEGQARTDIDAGFFSTAGLGDRVWFDTNRNGIQDAGETGVQGVSVVLRSGAGVVATQTTDANGNYFFGNLAPGQYTITFDPATLPTGYQFTTRGPQGIKDAIDSDPNATTGLTESITLASGEVDRSWDAGIFKREIDLAIRKDAAPVAPATGSPYLPGQQVQYTIVVTNNGPDDSAAGWIVTDALPAGLQSPTAPVVTVAADASCSWSGVSLTCNGLSGIRPAAVVAGINNAALPQQVSITYTVTIAAGAMGAITNTAQVVPNPADPAETIPLSAPSTNNRDPETINVNGIASLGDRVFIDSNGNGQQDSGEPGVAGVTVTLFDASGQVATTTTDSTGNYTFNNLTPNATYTVSLNNPANFATGGALAGYVLTPANVGNDATDSDATLVSGTPTIIGATTGAAGSNTPTYDFGFVQTASLGDRVWFDTNRNGVQDSGELGAPNVTVRLLDASGNLITTTTTDASGNYVFTGLTPGVAYIVEFVPLSGYVFSPQDQGGVEATDSDASTTSGRTAPITLAPGEARRDVDAGINQPPSAPVTVGNFVFRDTNGNGLQDAGEPGVSGVTATLTRTDGTPVTDTSGNPVPAASLATTTDANGAYQFTNLAPGQYTVTFSNLPAGTQPTTSNVGGNPAIDSNGLVATSQVLAAGQSDQTLDLGIVNTPALPASLGDKVFRDTNGNGIQDLGEPGVPGVTVTVTNSSGAPVGTATTDANGNYTVGNLPVGTYTVTFSNLPAGTQATTTNAPGSTAANDSNGLSSTVTLAAGENNPTIDLGIVNASTAPASLGDFVFRDTNGNGIQDPGEPGVPGIMVTITRTDGLPVRDPSGNPITPTQMTDGNGTYSFDNLAPGTYVVTFSNVPSGLTPTTTGAPGSTPATDSNGLTTTVTLVAGQRDPTIDLGLIPANNNASVTGNVFLDPNRDAVKNPGEVGVSTPVTVNLINPSGVVVGTTTTNANGDYTFTNVPAGPYTVVVPTGPSGLTATTPTTQPVTAVTGTTVRAPDIGYGPVTSGASVTGRVFLDPNRDGTRQPTEGPVTTGATVLLIDPTGTVIAQTTTDVNGNYTFPNVPPGNYRIEVIPPAGTTATTPTTRLVTVPPNAPVGTLIRAEDVGVAVGAREIPTLSAWMLAALSLMMVGIARRRMRR
jgi:uncharacterized repeat protein (TIGR01451 family)